MTPDSEAIRNSFEEAGQGHVFRFWDELDEAGRKNLLEQAAEIDLEEVERLVQKYVLVADSVGVDLSGLEPAPYIPCQGAGYSENDWQAALAAGEEALRAGKVAAFTVAGGQGTRLGYDGPKGTFQVTPVKRKPLFQVFAEKIRSASERYGVPIPWFIMTSTANHADTEAFFADNGYFGLGGEQVNFFMQGRMPAVDLKGKIMLEAPGALAMSPDGHGGSLRALVRSGAVEKMQQAGIEAISYFQVDNPLVQAIDPAFIGFHLMNGSEMSSKMIPKAYPKEKVGVFCRQHGKLVVIEYSDLPDDLTEAIDEAGQLRFVSGSIAIHILSREFVQRTGGGDVRFQLPFHRANKKVATIDDSGNPLAPDEPNGVKFEMFVFDALPFAQNPIVVETRREDEFSPVKNAEGVDSPKTSRDDQLRQWTRWLKAAGVDIPCDDTGLPAVVFEVSPLFAVSEKTFVERWNSLDNKPEIAEGAYLE